MKVLAVSASPRDGGNSDVLCDQFLKGAEEAVTSAGQKTDSYIVSRRKEKYGSYRKIEGLS